ncbi:MAG: hypothetical protein PHU65_04470 [Actinomycetota bacterium]|nr:hypothetical protein [Actinomycetota bacterium]
MDWGYAISFVSFFLAVAFLITTIIISGFYKRAGKIFLDENILVHWQYDKLSWSRFTENEYIADKKNKRFLFLTILVFVFIIAMIFILINREVWKGFLIIFSILLLITGILSFLIPELNKKNHLKTFPQAFVSLKGVYLTGEFHIWDYLTAKLEKVFIDKKYMLIKIEYSYITSYKKEYKEVRIPIPENKFDEAVRITEQLRKKTKNKK